MKTRVVFLALCMIMSIMLSGQNKETQLMEVKVTPPKFTGIENIVQFEKTIPLNSINQYVADNFVYPENSGFTFDGTEVIRFKVTTEGRLSDFQVINSVSKEVDEEIIKILNTTDGMWKPGYNNEAPETMEKEVTVEIKVAETEKGAEYRNFDLIAKIYFNNGTKHFFESGKLKKALRNFDNGVRYRPHDQSLYYMRGLCHYQLGHIEEAREDWMRLKYLGGFDLSDAYAEYNIKDLKGYEELTTMLMKNKQ